MTVQMGYSDKPTHIRVSAETSDDPDVRRTAQLWIEQEGVERYVPAMLGGATHPDDNLYERIEGHSETLAYATLEELLDLRDELNSAIQELVG